MSSGSHANYGTFASGGTALECVAARTARRNVTIQNVHATQILYVGSDTNVTTANGLKVAAAGGTLTLVEYNGPVWTIASGAATDTRFFESY